MFKDPFTDGIVEYGVALLPLILPQILFTPLDGRQLLPWSIFVSRELGRSLVFRRSRFNENPHTVVTYMLLHADANHLQGNIIGLVTNGHSMFVEAGAAGLWIGVLAGGVFAALDPFDLKALQLSKRLGNLVTVKTAPDNSLVKWWNHGTERVAKTVAPYLLDRSEFIGSSGGVAALAGASFVFSLRQLYGAYQKYPERSKSETSRRVIGALLNLSTGIQYGYTEYIRMTSGGTGGIDHAGHVTGLLFGGILAANITFFRL